VAATGEEAKLDIINKAGADATATFCHPVALQ